MFIKTLKNTIQVKKVLKTFFDYMIADMINDKKSSGD